MFCWQDGIRKEDEGDRFSDTRGAESWDESPTVEGQNESKSTRTNAIDAEVISEDTEKLRGRWFDADIASQEHHAQSVKAQLLSGDDVGNDMQSSESQPLLLTERLNQLVMIRVSRKVQTAKQYMWVHTLMAIEQAEATQALFANGDPRIEGIHRQIKTARQLRKAIDYQQTQSVQ